MIAIPAVDLREGAAVQLVGGDYAAERVRRPDAVAQASAFRDAGFSRLHVVDLDRATGRGDNGDVIEQIIGLSGLRVQVGGGIRSRSQIEALLLSGAASVVVGTRAVEDRAFLEDVAGAFPGRIVVALDVREREVVTRGWSARSGHDVIAFLAELEALELGGVLMTAVHVEGTLAGVDAELYRVAKAASRHAIIASGGIGSLADLRELAAIGVAGAVIGMALYTGAIDAAQVAQEFNS